MNELLFKIRNIINKFDPDNLHPGEMTPEDEYDLEVSNIIEMVKTVGSFDKFNRELCKMLSKKEGENKNFKTECLKVAQNLFSLREKIVQTFDENWSKRYRDKRVMLEKKAKEFNRRLKEKD